MTNPSPELLKAILAKAEEVKKDPNRFAAYADDPIGMARDVFGMRRQPHQPEIFFPNDCSLWTKQQDLLSACVTHRRVACKSGHGVSKSHTMAVLIAWWHLARKGRLISTGPTREHIADVLWPELHHVIRQSLVPLPGQLDSLHWSQDNYWYATGITTDQSSAFQGRHHPRLAVILDEAAGVQDAIHLEAGNCATGEENLIGMVGNPTLTSGAFYDAFQNPETWYPITISCLEHPNVLSGEELIPGAVSRRWVEMRRSEWSDQHPFWYSRVLGEFPMISEKGVIPLLWLNRALDDEARRKAIKDAEGQRIPRMAGLDVSRSGRNNTVLVIRRGDAVEAMLSWHHTSTMETCGKLILAQREWGFTEVAIDASGIGGGVVDRLYELELPFRFHAHNGGHRAGRSGYYTNRRTELWWHLRNRLEKARLWLPPHHPDIGRLKNDLLAPTWDPTSGGKIKVETKEDLLDRGVKSPDWADALTLSFAMIDAPDDELEINLPVSGQDQSAYRDMVPASNPASDYAELPDGF